MGAPFAIGAGDVIDAITEVFLLLQWQLPVLPIACMVLGYFIARKTQRSAFNWILVGLLNGIIPVLGPILMVIAYFFYPPPAPSTKRGYHPPKSSERGKPRGGERRPRSGERRPRDRR